MLWDKKLAGRSSKGLFTCALAPTAARARATRKNFMAVVSMLKSNVRVRVVVERALLIERQDK